MTPGRTARRFNLIVMISLCGALALGSFWVLEVMRRSMDTDNPRPPRTEPDYYIDDFAFVRMSPTGEAQYDISGKHLTHYPGDDTNAVVLPLVHSLATDRPAMTATSKRALVDQNNSKIHMYEDVQMDRPATATSDHFHLTSEYLLLLPDDDIVKTDKPVEITLGTSKLLGTGMVANNATRDLQLDSKVHATYQPPKPEAGR
jgi:lipopolysaccharide export system protein LptC